MTKKQNSTDEIKGFENPPVTKEDPQTIIIPSGFNDPPVTKRDTPPGPTEKDG